MQTAKIFNNGNSQAVRIPKEYRFDNKEVVIKKVGSAIILFPEDARLSILTESINEFTPDFLELGRSPQVLQTEREVLD